MTGSIGQWANFIAVGFTINGDGVSCIFQDWKGLGQGLPFHQFGAGLQQLFGDWVESQDPLLLIQDQSSGRQALKDRTAVVGHQASAKQRPGHQQRHRGQQPGHEVEESR